jgi:hypothetical protein
MGRYGAANSRDNKEWCADHRDQVTGGYRRLNHRDFAASESRSAWIVFDTKSRRPVHLSVVCETMAMCLNCECTKPAAALQPLAARPAIALLQYGHNYISVPFEPMTECGSIFASLGRHRINKLVANSSILSASCMSLYSSR